MASVTRGGRGGGRDGRGRGEIAAQNGGPTGRGRSGGRASQRGGETLGGRGGRRGEVRGGRGGGRDGGRVGERAAGGPTGRGRSGGRASGPGRGRSGQGTTTPRSIISSGTKKVFIKYEESGDIVPATIVQEPFHPRYLYRLSLDETGEEVMAKRNEVFAPDEVPPTTEADKRKTKADSKGRTLSPWQKSQARARLRAMLLDEQSEIHFVDLQTIHNDIEEFNRRPFKKFKEYHKNMKEKIDRDLTVVSNDKANLVHDRALYPRGALDITGQPFYDTHQSKVLLAEEAKAKTGRKPGLIRQDDPSHLEFSPKAFRHHLYQEKRKEKEIPAWQFRRNKVGRRQHEQDSEDENVRPS